ncbi:hypothetical protein ACI2LF_23020 [Kribbella sp. NPDC020789]
MTHELKALMDRGSDRPNHYFAPDPAAILAAGRRRSRVRGLAVGSTLLAALIVLAAGALVVLPDQDAPVAGLPDRVQDSYKQCDTSSGRRLGKDSWAWPEIMTLTDEYGSASLRRDPNDPNRVAYCVTQPDAPAGYLPLAQSRGIVVRMTPIDPGSSVTTVFGRVYVHAGGTVLVAVGKDGNRVLPHHLKDTAEAGTTAAALSKFGEARISGTYFAYRIVRQQPWPGDQPVVTVASYQPAGNMINYGTW